MSLSATIGSIRWEELAGAHGSAEAVPSILRGVAKAKGERLYKQMGALRAHVLDHGSLYSATIPTVRILIAIARDSHPGERLALYHFLAEFTESAHEAIESGRGPDAWSPASVGEAIRDELRAADAQLIRDLGADDPQLRTIATRLLLAFDDASADMLSLAMDRYSSEPVAEVRASLLSGIIRSRARAHDWSDFLAAVLARETDAACRFLLRHAEVLDRRAKASDAAVNDLVRQFTDIQGAYSAEFVDAVTRLDPERSAAALGSALLAVSEQYLAILLAQQLLRLVFHDKRSGWEWYSSQYLNPDGTHPHGTANSPLRLAKLVLEVLLWRLFPFLRRRSAPAKRRTGIPVIQYKVKGGPPDTVANFTPAQRTALEAIAAQPLLWGIKTNLWSLFRLPDSAEALQRLLV